MSVVEVDMLREARRAVHLRMIEVIIHDLRVCSGQSWLLRELIYTAGAIVCEQGDGRSIK